MFCPLLEKGCGGCSDIDKMYGETLKVKDERLHKLFPHAEKMLGCEMPLRYRNKVIRTFADGKETLYSGIYKAGTHQVLSVRSCCLEDERLNEIAFKVTRMLADRGYKAYREDFKRGQLRHMILRRAPFSSQILLTLVVGTENVEGLDQFAADVMKRFPDIKGVILNCNDRENSAVLGFKDTLLRGKNEIWDQLCGLNVCLNGCTFYQVNAPQTQRLYSLAIEQAELTQNDSVLDAYCGVGVIGMLAAAKAGRVTGIEIVKDSVLCAEKAKQRNQIANIRFIQGDVMKALRDETEHYSCVFLDPPRAGLSPDFAEALISHSPEKIVYISCNPETLKRDADKLMQNGYRAEFVRGVDMFPFTEHVETITLMSKINK